jgi:hypothetical protein
MSLCEEKSRVKLTTGRPPHRRDGHRRVGGRRGGQPQRQEEGRHRSVRSGQLCFIYNILSFGGKKNAGIIAHFAIDKLPLAGKNLGRVFKFKSSHLHSEDLWCYQSNCLT